MFKGLLLNISAFVTEKLTDHPEYGIAGSAVTVVASPLTMLQIIGAVLGVIIAILTLVIKTIELVNKIKSLRAEKSNKEDSEDNEKADWKYCTITRINGGTIN